MLDREDGRKFVAHIARHLVGPVHLSIAHAARCVVERVYDLSPAVTGGPNGLASVTSSVAE